MDRKLGNILRLGVGTGWKILRTVISGIASIIPDHLTEDRRTRKARVRQAPRSESGPRVLTHDEIDMVGASPDPWFWEKPHHIFDNAPSAEFGDPSFTLDPIESSRRIDLLHEHPYANQPLISVQDDLQRSEWL